MYRVAYLLLEKLMLTSQARIIEYKLTAKNNFNFGLNIMWSASRRATLYLYGGNGAALQRL